MTKSQGSEQEVWRAAPGLEGRYEVSSFGRIRNSRNGRIRKLKICKRGYHWLGINDGRGFSTNASVARLVCEAFNGPPPQPRMDCDHENRKRGDNRPENLRWLTRSENLANRVVCYGEGHAHAKLTEQAVRLIRSTPFRRRFDRDMAEILGVSRETVRDARLGKVWGHVR